MWEILERAIGHSTDRSEDLHPTASLYSLFEDFCQQACQKGIMTTKERELVLGMSQMWRAYVGDPIDSQPPKFFFLEDCINGGKQKDSVFGFLQLALADDCFIPTNYQKIIADLNKFSSEGAHLV